jgi:hypothetical protein
MKKVNWLIQKDVFPEYESQLISTINSDELSVAHLIEFNPVFNHVKDIISDFTEDDILMFHGTIQLGRRLLKENLYPCVYLTLDNYECHRYYGVYGDLLLNSDYIMMGLNDVLRNKWKIFEYFEDYNVFLRPNNGFKSFTGQVLPKYNFETEFDTLIQSNGGLDSDQLVMLSSTKDFDNEYRFIVVGGNVISGCIYLNKQTRRNWEGIYNKPIYSSEHPELFKFAQKVAKLYQPDEVFNIDICQLNSGEYKIIEINSFCCGCLYGNDLEKVVLEINKHSIMDYIDVYGE